MKQLKTYRIDMKSVSIKNNQTIALASIPELEYSTFLELNVFSLMKSPGSHCANYYGFPYKDKIKLICCIAHDESNDIKISSCVVNEKQPYPSFTKNNFFLKKFKREIHKILGIVYTD